MGYRQGNQDGSGESRLREPLDVIDRLTDPVTQAVVESLDGRPTPATVHALAEAVASELDHQRRPVDVDRIPVVLHHIHLPKLHSVGVVRYDTAAKEVTHGTRFDEAVGAVAVLQRL